MSSHVLNMAGGGSGGPEYNILWLDGFRFYEDVIESGLCMPVSYGSGGGVSASVTSNDADLLPARFIVPGYSANSARAYLQIGRIDVTNIKRMVATVGAGSSQTRGVIFLSDMDYTQGPESWNNAHCVASGDGLYARNSVSNPDPRSGYLVLSLNEDNYTTTGSHYLYVGMDNGTTGFSGEYSHILYLYGINYELVP